MHVGGLHPEGHPRFEPYHLFVGMVPYMIDQARHAVDKEAHSYRGFLVGATVFAVQPSTQEIEMFSAGNLKSKKGKEKVCAEKKALNQAEKAGFTQVLGIVVAATTDRAKIQEVTAMPTATLHPCDDCLAMFEDHSQVRESTLVITAGIDVDIYEVHTSRELQEAALTKDFPDTEHIHRGFDNWGRRLNLFGRLYFEQQELDGADRTPYAELARMAISARDI